MLLFKIICVTEALTIISIDAPECDCLVPSGADEAVATMEFQGCNTAAMILHKAS